MSPSGAGPRTHLTPWVVSIRFLSYELRLAKRAGMELSQDFELRIPFGEMASFSIAPRVADHLNSCELRRFATLGYLPYRLQRKGSRNVYYLQWYSEGVTQKASPVVRGNHDYRSLFLNKLYEHELSLNCHGFQAVDYRKPINPGF